MSILTIDIGGTFIKFANMEKDMKILERGKIPTPKDCCDTLVEAIGKIKDGMSGIEGIAISMPGIIDSENGRCLMGGALSYNRGSNLGQLLSDRCGVRVHLENDANCSAMAEAKAGALAGVSCGVSFVFGTMVGCGIIIGGKLFKGMHFSAGEPSYIITSWRRGSARDNILGVSCGMPSVCRAYDKLKGYPEGFSTGELLFDAVEAGEKEACECLDNFTKEIAAQLFNAQTFLDPEKIAIGGGISARPSFLEYIQKNLDALYAGFPYDIPHAEIVCCKFRNDANLYGALQCFLAQDLLEPPL